MTLIMNAEWENRTWGRFWNFQKCIVAWNQDSGGDENGKSEEIKRECMLDERG